MQFKCFTKRTAGKVLTALVLAGAMAFSPIAASLTVSASDSKTQLENRQKELKQKKADNDKKLSLLKNDENKQSEYKKTLDSQIKTVQAQIDAINQQMRSLNQEIRDKQNQIADKQVAIERNYDKLKERLRALYVAGDASTLAIILNAKNVADFARKTEIIKSVTAHDVELMNRIKKEMKEIQKEKESVQSSKDTLAKKQKEMDARNSELNKLMEETDKNLNSIKIKQSDAKRVGNQLDSDISEASAALDKWYANYFAQKKAREESAKNSKENSGSSHGGNSSYSKPSSPPAHMSGSGWCWPVPGYMNLSQPFRGRRHKGVDISSGGIYGKRIVAARSGYVMFADFGSAANCHNRYGNCVEIDHGDGYTTLYAHCSSLCISSGTYVKAGQTIGYVGNTGMSFGAHLHFEVRRYGVPRNPMNFF